MSLMSVQQSVVNDEFDSILRSAFGKNNSDCRLVYDRSRDMRHYWDGNNIPAVDCIPAR